MIVTDNFVFIHTSRTGGTFLNRLILKHVPGAQMLRYHGHLGDLPDQYSHLPVIGFVRNPWDWYVSMYFDYRRKGQYIYKIVSDGGRLGFEETVSRFVNLGDKSDCSRNLLRKLRQAAPSAIEQQRRDHRQVPGLTSAHFESSAENCGYYSWLFQLMFGSGRAHRILIGRFENFIEEAKRLLIITGTPISQDIEDYIADTGPLNSSRRPIDYAGGYSSELRDLVAARDRYLIERFDYDFSLGSKFPKTDSYRQLGSVNVSELVDRVMAIPVELWQAENKKKPNRYRNLNETRHIMFRFVNSLDNVFDSHDLPLWDDWKDILLPIMEQAARSLGYKEYRFPRVMFAKLPAGGKIAPHVDVAASHYIHKIHVPLITNEKTIFDVGGRKEQLRAGEITEVNNKTSHAVRNDGDEDRIHFIFECYNVDDYGKTG